MCSPSPFLVATTGGFVFARRASTRCALAHPQPRYRGWTTGVNSKTGGRDRSGATGHCPAQQLARGVAWAVSAHAPRSRRWSAVDRRSPSECLARTRSREFTNSSATPSGSKRPPVRQLDDPADPAGRFGGHREALPDQQVIQVELKNRLRSSSLNVRGRPVGDSERFHIQPFDPGGRNGSSGNAASNVPISTPPRVSISTAVPRRSEPADPRDCVPPRSPGPPPPEVSAASGFDTPFNDHAGLQVEPLFSTTTPLAFGWVSSRKP